MAIMAINGHAQGEKAFLPPLSAKCRRTDRFLESSRQNCMDRESRPFAASYTVTVHPPNQGWEDRHRHRSSLMATSFFQKGLHGSFGLKALFE